MSELSDEEDVTPAPPPPPNFKKKVPSKTAVQSNVDELKNLKLRHVEEKDKCYKTIADMYGFLEKEVRKEIYGSRIGDLKLLEEFFDTNEELEGKIDKLVGYFKKCKRIIFFTGAGISTSTGISDFRSPKGVWVKGLLGEEVDNSIIDFIRALPSKSHMALVELQNKKKLFYLISQNCDSMFFVVFLKLDIHKKSGIVSKKISELHGNNFIEICEKCERKYQREYICHRKKRGNDHSTGRLCESKDCGRRLLEYTVDFGQSLPLEPLKRAWKATEKSDLMIVLGSSLTVPPAALMPKYVSEHGGKLVIVNLQKTPYSDISTLNIHAKIDDVMEKLMTKLKYPIPKFKLKKVLIIKKIIPKKILLVKEIDEQHDDVYSVTFIRKLNVNDIDLDLKKKPIKVILSEYAKENEELKEIIVKITFFGFYNEGEVKISHQISKNMRYTMLYNFEEKKWEIEQKKISLF